MAGLARTYDHTRVGGRAQVQPGDKNVVNHIHIERALFAGEETVAVATHVTYGPSRKRARENLGGMRLVKRLCGSHIVSEPKSHSAFKSQRRWGSGFSHRLTLDPVSWNNNHGTGHAASYRTIVYSSEQGQAAQRQLGRVSANTELISLLLALIAFLAGRHISLQEVTRFFQRCRNDEYLATVTLLLGIGLGRYWTNHITRNVPTNMDDGIILENIFGQEVFVPFSTCADFSILSAFVRVHHQNTPGWTLVGANQYNLRLGSRRGLVLCVHDWLDVGLFKPKSRIVMSVYLQTAQPKCYTCLSDLYITRPFSEFFCPGCDKWCRSDSSLEYLAQLAAGPLTTSTPSSGFFSIHNIDMEIASTEVPGRSSTIPHSLRNGFGSEALARTSNDVKFHLDQVKMQFSERPWLYNQFLHVLRCFKEKSVNVPWVLSQVLKLLCGQTSLARGFDAFLPSGWKLFPVTFKCHDLPLVEIDGNPYTIADLEKEYFLVPPSHDIAEAISHADNFKERISQLRIEHANFFEKYGL